MELSVPMDYNFGQTTVATMPPSYAASVYTSPRAEKPLYSPGAATDATIKLLDGGANPIRTLTPEEFQHYYKFTKNTGNKFYQRYAVALVLRDDIKRSNPFNYYIPDDLAQLLKDGEALKLPGFEVNLKTALNEVKLFESYLRTSRPPQAYQGISYNDAMADMLRIINVAHQRNWEHMSENEILYEREMIEKAKLIARYQAEAQKDWRVGQMMRTAEFIRQNVDAYLAQVILENLPIVKQFNAFQKQELDDFKAYLKKQINDGYLTPALAQIELKKFLGILAKAENKSMIRAFFLSATPYQHPMLPMVSNG